MGERELDGIDVTEEELMNEAAKLLASRERQPGQMTVTILCDMTGISRRVANSRLSKLVDDGVLKKNDIIEDGHVAKAYEPDVDGGWKEVIGLLKQES